MDRIESLEKKAVEVVMKMTPMDDLLFASIYHDNIPAANELLRVY